MPATRRKSGASTAASSQPSQQSTLSFNNKPSRVTKSNAVGTSHKKSKLSEPAEKRITTISTPEPEQVIEAEDLVIRSPPSKTLIPLRKSKTKSDGFDEVREKAGRVSDAQIRKYWKAEEDSRLAPRIHQQAVPLPEKVLRHFDLSSSYGPCIGIPRLSRWYRAERLSLDPPIEVLAVLLKEEAKGDKRDAGRIAYIDELGDGRKGLVD